MAEPTWIDEEVRIVEYRKTGRLVCDCCYAVKPGHKGFCYWSRRQEKKR